MRYAHSESTKNLRIQRPSSATFSNNATRKHLCESRDGQTRIVSCCAVRFVVDPPRAALMGQFECKGVSLSAHFLLLCSEDSSSGTTGRLFLLKSGRRLCLNTIRRPSENTLKRSVKETIWSYCAEYFSVFNVQNAALKDLQFSRAESPNLHLPLALVFLSLAPFQFRTRPSVFTQSAPCPSHSIGLLVAPVACARCKKSKIRLSPRHRRLYRRPR